MGKGTLIAIEGVDASGKQTQTDLLYERLRAEGRAVKKVAFPDYASRAAGAVKMYLEGEFGKDPNDVNPYAASAFFAIDRFASYKKDWGAFLDAGGIVVADRYTMSNMIHQGAKFARDQELRVYLDWLRDLEFTKFGLPEPDLVIFLDLSMSFRLRLLAGREGDPGDHRKPPLSDAREVDIHERDALYETARGIGKGGEVDIHERDALYLNNAHLCAQKIANMLGWTKVSAERDGVLRPAADIHRELYEIVAAAFAK
ncbi:MAG: thymidylate kinase [Clostridiales bacterium]|jgi:dTMP kinase|nr:thymidylate kinase [Clostridiales bacterium]